MLNVQTLATPALIRILRFAPTPNWTARYPHISRLERCKVRALCHTLLERTDYTVYAGPFSAMRLADNLKLSVDPKFIVGSYEEEAHEIINDVICAAPENIVDIGSSFGYYAVGFALKIADTHVTAFEAQETPYWQQLAVLARINGVSGKITQRGFCTTAELEKVVKPNSFILCDCEGAEEDLLDPVEIPALRSSKILVELHEMHRPNVMGTLVSRFRSSHQIRIIEERERNPDRYRILKNLPSRWQAVAMEETRWVPRPNLPMTTWLRFMLLEPKA